MDALLQECIGALTRIKTENKELDDELKQAAGYAVFPAIGRAGTVIGGAYGHGVVFVRGDPIGVATIGQMTLGVQVGGQTFSEIVIFHSPEALRRFQNGRIAVAASASADIVKAAATGTADYEKDVTVRAYSQGGTLLELSLGVQKFSFQSRSPQQGPQPASGEESHKGKKKHEKKG